MNDGNLQNVSLAELEVHSNGKTMTFHLVNVDAPHLQQRLVCSNVVSIAFHRRPDDEAPYYIGELRWQDARATKVGGQLRQLRHDQFDRECESLRPLSLVCVQFEGAISGNVLAETVELLADEMN